jgi:hypothetical protein
MKNYHQRHLNFENFIWTACDSYFLLKLLLQQKITKISHTISLHPHVMGASFRTINLTVQWPVVNLREGNAGQRAKRTNTPVNEH